MAPNAEETWAVSPMNETVVHSHSAFFFSSLASEEAVSNPAITKHYFLGGIHLSWQWKVRIHVGFLWCICAYCVLYHVMHRSWDLMGSLCLLRPPHLGRDLVCKESKKNFKATIAMSQDFPLGIESWVFPWERCGSEQPFSSVTASLPQFAECFGGDCPLQAL